ncbi:cytochrome c [Terriglobus sp. TAA 43]|uniref:c-type cytochrome n=1 Tax=Terriglobus sp. TAA 43 TaxID=278961 RepID=UPI0006487056|nr:cytochrome c [Terriglobus sp. TAA 43]
MTKRLSTVALVSALCCFALSACNEPPGKPGPAIEAPRPQQINSFAVLYKQNCAACHGENGKGGAAISLANPAYIATAGQSSIQHIIAQGVAGTMMPGFGKGAGGFLTDAQIATLAQGIVSSWGKPADFLNVKMLPYAASNAGDVARGKVAYVTYCQRCHGNNTGASDASRSKSILDPTYLALISDQGLRSLIIAGHMDARIDWRSYVSGSNSHELTDAEVTDIVAWMTSHRTENPGQPYPQRP